MPDTTVLPPPITRPNGKVWRGRKQIRTSEFYDYDEQLCLVVLGTHDIELATTIAMQTRTWTDGELFYAEPRTSWWRLVPWERTGQFDSSWITDPVRGTPCVVFEP